MLGKNIQTTPRKFQASSWEVLNYWEFSAELGVNVYCNSFHFNRMIAYENSLLFALALKENK